MNQQQLDLPWILSGGESTGIKSALEAAPNVPKRGELHVHMNGAIPAAMIREILADEMTPLPTGFDLQKSLVRLTPCSSLADYLTPWQILRLFPKKRINLDRLTMSVFDSFAENQVSFVELRSSLLYLATLQQCSPAQALERLIESTEAAARYHNIHCGLIITVTRGDYSAVGLATILQAFEDLGQPKQVVGLDLAGDEETPYPVELPSMFRNAKERYGLGITIHAGETGRSENVRTAVELFDADRIGHGTAAGKDLGLLELLAERRICIEVCPISNRLTGAVPPNDAHPLQEFRRHGVPFVICSDNPAIHQHGLADDQAAALAEGLSIGEMQQQYEIAKRYSFMEGLS